MTELTQQTDRPETDHPETDPLAAAITTGPSRRVVLRAVAVSGAAAAVLAACGGGDDTGGTTGGPASPSGSEESSGDTGGAASDLVATADVPVGSGVILEDKKVVVTQPAAGEFKAFTAICTHQACIVSSVKEDRISCACHGSAYSTKDGSVLNGPATRALREVRVTVEGDQVVEA